ncbi:MAG: 3D domain-containing protein [Armatimonadota bacterium]|nr:3D domain-containing protein [Armatimonadota bacterium]
MRGRKSRLARTALCITLVIAIMPAVRANRTDVAQDQSLETVTVRVICDGAQRQVRTAQTTVGATLEEAGIKLKPADQVYPSKDARPKNNMAIRVIRVVEKVIVKKEVVGFKLIRRPSRLLRPGQVRVVQAGVPGERQKIYKVIYKGGVLVSRSVTEDKLLVKPKDEIALVGDRRLSTRGFYTSRGSLRMHATGYDPGPRSCGRYADGYTANGMKAGYGVAAVDPKSIPLGTKLYIEGYGFAIAGDVGKAIKGKRIDLGFDTYRQAIQFGRRHVVVHFLK